MKFNNQKSIDQYNTVVFSNSAGEKGISMESASEAARLVIISGEPLDQEVVQYGPVSFHTPKVLFRPVLKVVSVLF